MAHLDHFADLEKLKREVTYSLDSTWGFSRYFFAGYIGQAIRSAKKEYRLTLSSCLPAYRAVTAQLRRDCTLAYQAQVLPELPIGNYGRCISSLAFVSCLIDLWELYTPNTPRSKKVEALLVPLWQKMANKSMEVNYMKTYQPRFCRPMRWELEEEASSQLEWDPEATVPSMARLRDAIARPSEDQDRPPENQEESEENVESEESEDQEADMEELLS